MRERSVGRRTVAAWLTAALLAAGCSVTASDDSSAAATATTPAAETPADPAPSTADKPSDTTTTSTTAPPTTAAAAAPTTSTTVAAPTTTTSTTVAAPTTTAVAATAAEGLGDSFYPFLGNGGYDVLHYDIDLDVDPAANTIAAQTTISATAGKELSTFNLDLSGLEVHEVTVDGTRTPSSPAPVPS